MRFTTKRGENKKTYTDGLGGTCTVEFEVPGDGDGDTPELSGAEGGGKGEFTLPLLPPSSAGGPFESTPAGRILHCSL